MKKAILFNLLFPFFMLSVAWGQCFQVIDGNGVASDNPYFVSCTPGNFTVFIQVDQNIGPFVIDWGDGSPNSTGASLLTTGNESHTYAATTDTFNITITDAGSGCVVNGVVVLERNPLASIQLPAGDDNFGCTPVEFRFINSSTQVSQTTTFTWDFGDGSPIEVYDYTNAGDTITHIYLPGVGVQSCNLEVTLTATNYCGTSNASFFPLRVWDLDEAQIDASATLLCYPDTVVQYTNNTIRNCFPEGNQSQRFERWNFGDYWGLGYDSIIDWRPWNPPIINPPPIAYPGIGTYTAQLIDSSFCGLDTALINITISPPPTALLTSDEDTICEGEQVRFFNNSVGGANRFSWNFDRGQGWQNLNGNTKNRRFDNAGDYTIRLAVRIDGAQGCNDTAAVDLYVNPSPATNFNFTPNDQCDSMLVGFNESSAGNVVSWNWTFDNGNTFNGQNPPDQFYGAPGTYNVKLVTENPQSCSDSLTQSLRVRETPTAAFTVNNVCLNTIAAFTDQSTAGLDPITSYKWYFGDGDSSTAQNPNHLYTAFGNYTVMQIVDNGFCQDTATLNVTVEDNPTAAFAVDTNQGCSRLTVNFTNQSSINATTFTWNFGDGSSPVVARDTFHTYTNNFGKDTSFVVEMIAQTTFGCADTIYDTITVFPVPVPSFTSDATLDCGPVSVNFTNTTQGDSLDFFWNFGDGSGIVNDTNPTHIFQNQTLFINNYDVSLIVVSNNGCRDTTTQQVTVYPEPIFTFNAVPDSGCSPLRVTFPSVVGAVDYQWDFGDGNTASGPTPTHTFINNTTNNQTYTVRLIARNSFGCVDTTFGFVLVYPNPTSNFSVDTTVGCQPLPIAITNSSTGANQFAWDFGDGSNSDTTVANFTKTYTNSSATAQFNTIRLISITADGCRDTATQQIEVHPFISVDFTSDSVGCSPYPVAFNNQSVGAATYSWSYGDGNFSTNTNPSHVYINSSNGNQNFQSRLIGTSTEGCADTATQNILVYPKPQADFVLDTNRGCQPLELQVTNNSLIADSIRWVFGDGTTSNNASGNFTKTYTNTSQSSLFNTLQLFVRTNNGCADTLSRLVEVHPFIAVDFTSDTVGCQPYPVRFNNQSIGAANFAWDFGDGNTSAATNPQNVYQNTTTANQIYLAELIGTSAEGCADTATQNILVYPKPQADFVLDTNRGCQPLGVQITNNSVIADSLLWTFGDGTTANTAAAVFTKTYTNTAQTSSFNTLRLIVRTDNGCADTLSRQIEVHPFVQAAFTSDTVGCSPYSLPFNNQSVGASNFAWNFGDGASSPASNPRHTYVNSSLNNQTYQSQLIVTSPQGCQDTASRSILVYPKPQALFSVNDSVGCHPLPVNFTNQSQLADSCIWRYGDGNGRNDCAPSFSHIFSNTTSFFPVNYQARLIVITDNNCRDTATKTFTVNPQIIADFDADTAGCQPLPIQFADRSTGAALYEWRFGDGAASPQTNPLHTYLNFTRADTSFQAELVVRNNFGCTDTARQDITVYPKPTADYSINTNDGCQPLPVDFTNASIIADSCFWVFGDGASISDCSPVVSHTYTNTLSIVPITFNSRLEVYTNRGCADTLSRSIQVRPQVTADFTADTIGCSPLDATFRSQSFGAISYQWDFGNGRIGMGQITTNRYTNTGSADSTYQVRLIAQSLYQCNDTAFKNILVRPTPIPDFNVTPAFQVFPNATVTIDNQTNQGNWDYFWDFKDSTTSTLEEPGSHTYGTWGQYLIKLRASSAFCADSLEKLIEIDVPVPVADFGDSASGCEPLEVQFTNQSLYGRSFQWDFGDGGTSTAENPRYTYLQEGDYTVTLRVLGFAPNKEDTEIKQNYIQVFNSPRAQFFANKDVVYIPNDPLVLSNTSIDADQFNWDFGDGNTSTERSPTHFYQEEGFFDIQLIAQTDFGCADTFMLPTTIQAELEGRLDVPNAFTPNPNGGNGGQVNPLASGANLNDVFYAKIQGAIDYELNIFNKWGELLFVSQDINIGWDGYYKGELCQQDVYVWKIKAEFADGESIVKVGDLMLLR